MALDLENLVSVLPASEISIAGTLKLTKAFLLFTATSFTLTHIS
jgi:hypothetical protein